MASSEDTEITLGVGKLLGLFFLLAAICGVFFSIGYSLGKSSGREQAAGDQPQVTVSADTAPSNSANEAGKPSAGVVKPQEPAQASSETAAAPTPEDKLTFYKAVQQSGTAGQPADDGHQATGSRKAESATTEKPEPMVADAKAPKNPADAPPHSSSVTGAGTLVVQIAALSREDDAVSLAGALRKKDYNVFVVNNPTTNDKLYHVQVGPFTTMPEAQAMKAKLVAEGYNPIIKR